MLLFFLVTLVFLDWAQRKAYVAGAALPAARGVWSGQDSCVRALLVSGTWLDDAERATCWRDLRTADAALGRLHKERLRTVVMAPPESHQQFQAACAASRPNDELVVFLTGHGGGRNFGCGRFNLTRQALAEDLRSAHFDRLLVVIDCCWAGEFVRSLGDIEGADIVTCTDAEHEAPFPTSFLSPNSFGRDFWDGMTDPVDVESAVAAANRRRRRWARVYPASIGTQGVLARVPKKKHS